MSNEKEIAGRIQNIFRNFSEQNPYPSCGLLYLNPYTLLVSVVLSAKSTDKSVNRVMSVLMSELDTPEKVLALGEEALRKKIQSIGCYSRKSQYIMELSRLLRNRYQNQVPTSREALMALPGVGRKTANVVLNVAFGQPTIPVDTHVFRVAQRLGLALGKTPEAVEQQLEAIIPDPYKKRAHHWLIQLGRSHCKAQRPLCALCSMVSLCPFANNQKTISMSSAIL